MHLKFLARGTGSAAAAAAYLLAKRDAAGTERAAVEVLRGDPIEVARVADSLPFKYLYTSGVIAWSLEDDPTRAEIERVLDEFEKTAWAGLDRDRYIWSAVLHRDHDGGVHVHILAARCDLATGRSLNIAPPGWEKTFDPLRDAFNYECGWSRPDDPTRARPYRPSPHLAYLNAETLRAGWEVEPDRRALIGEHLMRLVADGAVKDRGGVVAALEGLGFEVPRQGRHYVTILQPATGERLRLKGGLYEADFDRERVIRPVREPSVDWEPADRGDDAKRAAEAWGDLEEKRLKRAEYHRARYGRGGRVRAGGVRAAGDVERESGPVAAAAERAVVPESLAEHLREELGDEAVVAAVDSMAEQDRDLEASRGAAAGDATACLAVLARLGVVDDRDRATADDGVAGVVHAVRAGAEAAGRTDRGLAGAGRGLAATVRSARACGDALDRGIRDAGWDPWRALSTRVAGLEEAVCATSQGEPWLVEAQEAVLEGADRRLTLAARARAVKTVEGRLRVELADREEALRATSSGPALLQEALGKRSYGDAPLSFSARERGLEGVERRVREALTAREEALQRIPFGLAVSGQSRDAEGAAETLPDWESRVRRAEQQVEEELDRLEEELLAIAGGEDSLAEAAGVLAGAGRTRALVERWEACEGATSGVEEELDRREAVIRADPAGEDFLRDARLEFLGSAEREAATLGERARIAKAAAEAKRQAEEKAARVEKLRALPGGLDLYYAHLADRDPKWSLTETTPPPREHDEAALAAAESDGTRLKRLGAVLPDKTAKARYREVIEQVAGQFKTPDLDRALVAGERKQQAAAERRREAEKRRAHVEKREEALRATSLGVRWLDEAHQEALAGADRQLALVERERIADTVENRVSDLARRVVRRRVQALGKKLGGTDLFRAHLADLDPAWDRNRNNTKARENIDAALTATESDGTRQERLRVVLSDEADAARYREVLADSPGGFNTAILDRALAAGERARAEREASARRAAADLETATEEAQAAAARSKVKLDGDDVRVIYETGETHESGLSGVERTTAALAAAADQQLPPATIVKTWNANKSAPGGIAAALVTKTRVSRLERLFSAPRAAEAFIVALDGQDLSSRTPTHPKNIDRALDIAEREFSRAAERQFPGASSATGRRAGDDVTEAADTDRHLQQVIDWLRTEVERQQVEALRARTGADRLDQRNRNSERPIAKKSPPVRKPARRVPDATWADAVDAVLPGAEQRELRLGIAHAARELAAEFRNFRWWGHAGGELEELHWREDRYTKEGPVVGMLRTVLEQNVYEKAVPLVEHPVAEPDPPPPNVVELVRPFIRWLQDAVDRLIDRILDREPAQPPRPAAAADQVPARPVPQPPVAPTEPSLRQPVPPAASPSSATAPAPEPAALNVTEAERVRVAVDAVEAELPRTRPYFVNPSHRPPALSDERFDHLAAAATDEFAKMVIAELQRRQGYYTDSARSESEKRHLHPDIAQKNEENQRAYKEAEAARSLFSRRPPEPTWAEAESVVIKEFEAKQLVLIEGVCRTIQQQLPATIRHEFERLEPERAKAARQERNEDLPKRPSESSRIDQTKERDQDPGPTR